MIQECVCCNCSCNNNAALCKLGIQTKNLKTLRRKLVKPVRTRCTMIWAKLSHDCWIGWAFEVNGRWSQTTVTCCSKTFGATAEILSRLSLGLCLCLALARSCSRSHSLSLALARSRSHSLSLALALSAVPFSFLFQHTVLHLHALKHVSNSEAIAGWANFRWSTSTS